MSFYSAFKTKLRTYPRHAGPDQIVHDFVLPLAQRVDQLTAENTSLKLRLSKLEGGPAPHVTTIRPTSNDDLAAGGVL